METQQTAHTQVNSAPTLSAGAATCEDGSSGEALEPTIVQCEHMSSSIAVTRAELRQPNTLTIPLVSVQPGDALSAPDRHSNARLLEVRTDA